MIIPEVARIVFVVLIANLVASLLAVTLPLAAVLDAVGAVLSEVIAWCSGTADIRRTRTT
jgi:hypothetical protein